MTRSELTYEGAAFLAFYAAGLASGYLIAALPFQPTAAALLSAPVASDNGEHDRDRT